jgi:hypothetical protein
MGFGEAGEVWDESARAEDGFAGWQKNKQCDGPFGSAARKDRRARFVSRA